MKGFDLTALRNVVDALGDEQDSTAALSEQFGGNWKGVFTFTLQDPATGTVVEQVEHNSLVDEGRNAVLRYLGEVTANSGTVNFSGDGSRKIFQLPHPYRPVNDVVSVTVGGASQTEHNDFSVDYTTGEFHFNSAPSDNTDNVAIEVEHMPHPFVWLAIGDDGTSHDSGQSALQNGVNRTGSNTDYPKHDSSAVSLEYRWTFGTGFSTTVREAGIFNAPPTAPVDGDMFNRTVVSPELSKPADLELIVTWTLSMT